jgi:ABC-type glycerol-3-phosphate transport system permease component
VGLVAALPVFWVVSMSFKVPGELFTAPPRWLPAAPTLENFRFVIFGTPVPKLFLNSVVISGLTTLLTLLLATVAAYAFSRFSFRAKGTLLLLLLGTQLIPGVSNAVPLYVMMRSVGLLDTQVALVLIYAAALVPLSVWILKATFDQVPATLDEAAMIDGCTRLGAFRRVVLPLIGPGLIAAGTMIVVSTWNEFFLAFILTSSPASRTIATGMYLFQGQYGNSAWNLVSAAAVVTILVPLLLFALFQNYMVGGLSAGATKG